MRRVLRIAAVLLFLAAVCFWFSRGAGVGLSHTTAVVMKYDRHTGQRYPVTIQRFRPGLDFLALSLAGSVVLLFVSFEKRRD